MISSDDLSLAERCLRLPKLVHGLIPDQHFIREAAKRYFLKYACKADPERVKATFLNEASERGFIYPEDGDPYTLANDVASWLEGVLLLAQELYQRAGDIPMFYAGDKFFKTTGFVDPQGNAHILRVTPHLEEYRARWPETLLSAANFDKQIFIHRWKMPAFYKGRLSSPLSMAYQHPMTGGYRLAHLDGEKKFGNSWKRFGRWELPEMDWNEWREGIRRDKCLDLICTDDEFPSLPTRKRKPVIVMARNLMRRITYNAPKKLETCPGCIMYDYCHGNPGERRTFKTRSGKKALYAVPPIALRDLLPSKKGR